MNRRMLKSCRLAISLLFLVFFHAIQSDAQTKDVYHYQDLSNTFYARQKDSIKRNWGCPSLYKEKETQKKYKEIWDGRTSFITEAIESNSFVRDNEVYDYINQVLNEIVKANPKYFPQKVTLLIDRSSSANAYTIGGNIIAVNTGLITFARCREEIALVIAHELGHNILEHTDKAMKEKAEWLTRKNIKNH